MTINQKGTSIKQYLRKWRHKLFSCPTFWKIEKSFRCPGCHIKYRCYYDGNDIVGYGADYCDTCTSIIKNNRKENIEYDKGHYSDFSRDVEQ